MGAVTLALVLASLALLVVLHDSVQNNAVATASSRAHDVATELTTDGQVAAGVDVAPGLGDGAHVQVLLEGDVVGSSPSVAGQPALSTAPATVGSAQQVPAETTGPGPGPFVTVVLGVSGVAGADTVVVQQSYAGGSETVVDAAQALLLAVPALVLVVGAMTYVLTGRALRPVEQIRRRTSQIGAADTGTRIDVPATGDEVAQLAITLNTMLDRLHESAQAQARFVADASHELRTPLAAVRAELDVATRQGGSADWAAAARHIGASNDRMQQLVDDLLVLTRTSERSAVRRDAEVDLDEVVEHVGYALGRAAPVTVEVSTRPARVRGDASELERALQNLADNAALHASHRVRLSVEVDGPSAVVRVDDDGPGIPVDARAVVFDRFVRLDAGRARAEGGSGLGLAIVAGIVASHGGTVVARESDLGGAAFVVVLPLLEPQSPSAAIR